MTMTEIPAAWLPLVDSGVKATLVLGAAGVAAYMLRHASAALRHLIWTLALVSALLMPVLSLALPRWQLPLVTVATAGGTVGQDFRLKAEVTKATPPSAEPTAPVTPRANRPGSTTVDSPAAIASSQSPLSLSWPQFLFAIWSLGVLLIVGRVAAGLLAVRWMAYRGQRVLDAPWMKMAIALASEVGVSPNITFLRSGRATMPMACGVLRPAVMMPADADEWPADRLRIVLLHELAHVKRHDCLTHLVAQLACACHWFNPLAWIAARHVRTERERACDDLVLSAGTHGPDYADQLLEIARAMRSGRGVLAGASLAMAHRSQLEGRLMAILDPRVPHSALSRVRAAAATAVCCAAVVPLAALQPWGDAAPAVVVTESSMQAPTPTPASTPSPTPTPAPTPTPTPTTPRFGRGMSQQDVAEAAHAVAGAIADAVTGATVAGVIHGNAHAQDTDTDNEKSNDNHPHDGQDAKAASAKADPRMVAALTAALKDSDKEVRETALHALVQMRDPSVFEPLVQALKDAVPDVREQAAHGLGQLRDRRAVEPLAVALRDEHADVREQAAFALSRIRDRAAIPALTSALKDPDAEVREQVVFALSQFRDPATIEGFTIALRDTNADVREKAAFALGQLRDRKAIEPLISALKDADADVREQAAFALGQLRDRAAVEALVIALKDTSASVREQAAFALGQIRDPRAIDGLTGALRDPQAGVRQQAAFALGQLAR